MAEYRKRARRNADGTKELDSDGRVITETVEIVGDELTALLARRAVPKTKRREGEFREFLALLTDEEQLAFQTAALSNPALALWLNRAMGGATMSLDHPDTDKGLSAAVSFGLMTLERKAIVLASDFDLV